MSLHRALVLVLLLAACAGRDDEPLRLTVVGIDGATWRVMDPMLERGELPAIADLIERGARGPLRSEKPLTSPPIWTTVVTGVSRERHGIGPFVNDRGELVSSRDRRSPALWLFASRAGLRSAVVGWWGTYPAEHIDGVVISERALKTRESDTRALFGGRLDDPQLARLAHPSEALRLVEGPLSAAPDLSDVRSERVRVARTMRVEDRAVVEALLAARERFGPFDLELLLLRGVDPVSHFFWKFYEPDSRAYPPSERPDPRAVARWSGAIEDHYRFVDGLLARLVEDDPHRVFLLISDHGFEAGRQRFHSGTMLSGTHRSDAAVDGIIVASGGPFRAGAELRGATIYDVAPIALQLLSLGIPEDLEGRVVEGALDPGWRARHPIRRIPPWPGSPVALPDSADPRSPLDDRMLEELRELGYVE